MPELYPSGACAACYYGPCIMETPCEQAISQPRAEAIAFAYDVLRTNATGSITSAARQAREDLEVRARRRSLGRGIDHHELHRAIEETIAGYLTVAAWRPIAEAKPRTWYEVAGPSDHVDVPVRIHVAWLQLGDAGPRWRTHDGGDFTDDGEPPTHFRPLSLPEAYR